MVKWPANLPVTYSRSNNWDAISSYHRDLIARYHNNWQSAWDQENFVPKIQVREIGPGHWAWSDDLSQKNLAYNAKYPNRQFEAVAAQDIDCEAFIGEYVGQVKYEQKGAPTTNLYITSLFIPSDSQLYLKMGRKFEGLCIDAGTEGNETRFINSVLPSTPKHVS